MRISCIIYELQEGAPRSWAGSPHFFHRLFNFLELSSSESARSVAKSVPVNQAHTGTPLPACLYHRKDFITSVPILEKNLE